MGKPALILASQSPRRREILSLTLLPFETIAVETPETLDPLLSIEENVTKIALEKAEEAMLLFPEKGCGTVILTADTVVAKGNESMENQPDLTKHSTCSKPSRTVRTASIPAL